MPREGGDSPYSFGREHRLAKEKEFQEVFRRGRKLDLGFAAFYILTKKEGLSRFGVVVPKKVDKRATRRNRIKRIYREFFRLNKPLFPKPVDMVVVVKEDVPQKPDEIKKLALDKILDAIEENS